MYEKSLKILGLSGNFDRLDLEVAYNNSKSKMLKNMSNVNDIRIIDDAYNYVLEDMLNKEELDTNIENLQQEKTDIRVLNLVKALEYVLDDEERLNKELRDYNVNFRDLDNAIHYFELVNMRESLESYKSRKY